MATRTATQLTITIPEGAPPGSLLSIPVKGRAETIKARVPEGLGPGSTLVLTQLEGTDEWVEESTLLQAEQARTLPQTLPESFPEDFGDEPLVPDGPVAYTVRLDTTVGIIDIIVRPDWAPNGARRFLQLAHSGDLDGLSFYRAVKGCLAQFGLPAKRQWQPLPDDPPTGVPFLLGAVCFAAVGKNSRKSTLFICTGDMSHCFGQSPWETPIGAVAEASLDALDRIETMYGDIVECGGSGPHTGEIHRQGDTYLRANFPQLTYIRTARPLDWPPAKAATSQAPGYAETQSASVASMQAQATEMMQAAQAVKAVFQGPNSSFQPSTHNGFTTGGSQPSTGAQANQSSTAFATQACPRGVVQHHGTTATAASVYGGASASNATAVRTTNVGAPLRFTAASSCTSSGSSFILPASCEAAGSFEQQAQAQVNALLQAQQMAQLQRPATQEQQPFTQRSSSLIIPVNTTFPSPIPPGQISTMPLHSHAPMVQMHTGSYVPPPGSYVPPPISPFPMPTSSGSYVPPPHMHPSSGSFVPPVQPLGSFTMPSLGLNTASLQSPIAAQHFSQGPPGPGPNAMTVFGLPFAQGGFGSCCAGGSSGSHYGPYGHSSALGPCGSGGMAPHTPSPLGFTKFPNIELPPMEMPKLVAPTIGPPFMPSLGTAGFMPPSPGMAGPPRQFGPDLSWQRPQGASINGP
jgi:peptidyl-prolyl cis-trans isomerase A (cyclophilin A)